MKKLCLVISVLSAIALLAACSGGAAQKPGASTPAQVSEKAVIEPEQLISKEEAAQLVGDVKDGEKTEQPVVGQKIMFYETTGGEGFLQISLTQQAFMATSGNTPASIYLGTKDAVASEFAETAEGLGDEYFFGTPGLHILYKGYYIVIAAGNSDDPAVRSVLKQAGALAVGNLDKILSK